MTGQSVFTWGALIEDGGGVSSSKESLLKTDRVLTAASHIWSLWAGEAHGSLRSLRSLSGDNGPDEVE